MLVYNEMIVKNVNITNVSESCLKAYSVYDPLTTVTSQRGDESRLYVYLFDHIIFSISNIESGEINVSDAERKPPSKPSV